MQTSTRHDALKQVLGEPCALAAKTPETDNATDVAGGRREKRLRSAVVGEAKCVMSTLINTLLGRKVLPYGVISLTALAEQVVGRRDPAAEAWRREHAAAVYMAIRATAERLGDGLTRDLAAIREATRDLLGVQLGLAATEIALAGDARERAPAPGRNTHHAPRRADRPLRLRRNSEGDGA